MNRYRKHGNDIGDIASCLVTKWKELLKQEQGTSQMSSSKAYDKELSDSHLVRESKVDQINNKHETSKHKTAEIKPKVGILPPGCILYLLAVKNTLLAPLRVFSLKRSTTGAFAVPLRVLIQKNLTGDNVLCKTWYL